MKIELVTKKKTIVDLYYVILKMKLTNEPLIKKQTNTYI